MRKHKSVVAILLAVMMIFTFMPTMAFADQVEGEAWNSDYTSVTVTQPDKTTKTYTNIKKTWDATTGLVTAQVDWTGYVGDHDDEDASISYYDFSFAKVKAGTNWNRESFTGYNEEEGTISNSNISVVFTKPSYVPDANVTGDPKAEPAWVAENWSGRRPYAGEKNLDVTVYYSGFDPKNYDAQTVSLTASVVPHGTGTTATHHAEYIDGTIAGATLTVGAGTATENDVLLAIDKIDTTNTHRANAWTIPTQTYDGATHKLVTNVVPGFKVAWKVQNASSKKYEDVTVVDFKNAGTYNVAVLITNETTKATNTYYKTIRVNNAGRVYVGFDQRTYSIAGTEFDPWDFVEVTPGESNPSDQLKDAVEADKDALKTLVKEAYEITQKPGKYDTSVITLTLALKKDYDAEAFYKAHKEALDNFNGNNTFRNGTMTATISTSVGDKEDDITFSGVTTKSFKAKKKTKKLASTKTFQVAAAADSGKVITFTGTSSNAKVSIDATGKVTVKKGLKKGTKVKLVVKAKTDAGNGYKACKETKTYTIKIK